MRSLYCPICSKDNNNTDNTNNTNNNNNNSKRDKLRYYRNIPQLLYHMRNEHRPSAYMCELCLTHSSLFVEAQRIFNKSGLRDHELYGSLIYENYPEAQAHAYCSLCQEKFYDKDTLYKHCTDKHFTCDLCRGSGANILKFYASPDLSMDHFRNMHYLCEHPKCRQSNIPSVFSDPFALRNHQTLEHGFQWNESKKTLTVSANYTFDGIVDEELDSNDVMDSELENNEIAWLNEAEATNNQNQMLIECFQSQQDILVIKLVLKN